MKSVGDSPVASILCWHPNNSLQLFPKQGGDIGPCSRGENGIFSISVALLSLVENPHSGKKTQLFSWMNFSDANSVLFGLRDLDSGRVFVNQTVSLRMWDERPNLSPPKRLTIQEGALSNAVSARFFLSPVLVYVSWRLFKRQNGFWLNHFAFWFGQDRESCVFRKKDIFILKIIGFCAILFLASLSSDEYATPLS